jgi:glycosyltransferase involved in cell wall biosynthesis
MSQRVPWLFSSPERPWAPPLPDPAITWQLRQMITAEPPDVVHGHDWLARSFLPLRRWSQRRYGTRFVTTLHYYTLSCAKKNLMRTERIGGELVESPCSGPGIGKCVACASHHYGRAMGTVTATTNLLGARAERHGASTIIAVSEAVARGNGLSPDDQAVVVVPNFLAETGASAGDDVSSWTELLPEGDFMLFVGDLRPMKGLDVLLAAYVGLPGAMPLVLVGKSWPDTPQDLPPGVTLHDRWPNTAVIEAFRRCSIAVVPSVWAEPFGIVVIEAMAGGSAVVASDIGGIPEIIRHGESGVLVPPGDPAALHRALAALIADPARRATMGAAARQRSQAFTAAAIVPQLENTYR